MPRRTIAYQMAQGASRIRQRIHRLEESLAELLKLIVAERGPLRRGSFVTLHRKCGKPTCHCAEGDGHPTNYLSLLEEGRKRLIYISADNRDQVADEAERYRQFRRRRAMIARIMKTLLKRLDELEKTLETQKPIQSRRGKSD